MKRPRICNHLCVVQRKCLQRSAAEKGMKFKKTCSQLLCEKTTPCYWHTHAVIWIYCRNPDRVWDPKCTMKTYSLQKCGVVRLLTGEVKVSGRKGYVTNNKRFRDWEQRAEQLVANMLSNPSVSSSTFKQFISSIFY